MVPFDPRQEVLAFYQTVARLQAPLEEHRAAEGEAVHLAAQLADVRSQLAASEAAKRELERTLEDLRAERSVEPGRVHPPVPLTPPTAAAADEYLEADGPSPTEKHAPADAPAIAAAETLFAVRQAAAANRNTALITTTNQKAATAARTIQNAATAETANQSAATAKRPSVKSVASTHKVFTLSPHVNGSCSKYIPPPLM